MKLIIDISEEDYNYVKKQVADGIINPLKMHIANGTPLDDVKTEIDKSQEPYKTSTAYDEGVRFGLMLAYQIVDKYKAESEDK